MSVNDMQLNPNNLSGIEFRVWKGKISSLALREPHKVQILKAYITEKLQADLCSELYKLVFNFLSKGQDKFGNPIIVPSTFDGNTSGQAIPLGKICYPHNKINNFGLQLVNSVMGEIETIISLAIPDNISDLANSRLKIGGAGKAVDI